MRRHISNLTPVPEEYLEAILQFGTQAPSGYNLQPWRFVVVREKANRERLQKAAYNQEKVVEAPVNIIAFAIKDDWKNYIDQVFQESVRRDYGKPEMIPGMKKMASDFLEKGISQQVWVNRHTMIALTTMMLVAEAYGLDTAPMEGFDPRQWVGNLVYRKMPRLLLSSPLAMEKHRTNRTADGLPFQKSSMTSTLAIHGNSNGKTASSIRKNVRTN